ncbi:hypothetical protein MICRO80W_180114 [Micrococcus luteus]|nr:hypothetical protein MICRO116_320016 [Micrococcus sp. 116]VWX49148.1 hypothetical protein MICRO80W_180114 [Micrococcus luteus]
MSRVVATRTRALGVRGIRAARLSTPAGLN